jgi:O-ureido-D-serine cyclo-ligase
LHRIALVSARVALDLDEDMPLLADASRRAGLAVETPCWDDDEVDWSRFDLAVLRSTWDYAERIDEFLDWAQRCAARTRLVNSPDVVAWNTDKHYLATLHEAGEAVVPTRFVEPGADASAALETFLGDEARALDVGEPHGPVDEFVVKPSIGAGSRDAARYRRDDRDAALSHLVRLVDAERRSALLQPYLQSVDAQGETALVYFCDEPSHAICKGPLLRRGGGLVAGLFAPEQITAREPTAEERRLAAAAHVAIPFPTPLYARIDMIHDARGVPVVLELELTEPSLFFTHAPGSADRFARLLCEELQST